MGRWKGCWGQERDGKTERLLGIGKGKEKVVWRLDGETEIGLGIGKR